MMLMKKTILLVTVLLPMSMSMASVQKPNVLVIYMDDMGCGQPGCYGGKLAPTPNMDSIAANGVRFTDGYVSACVCSPSRVGLLTGRYQARSGHDANSEGAGSEYKNLALTETLFPQRMKDAGYTTGIVGKWHVGSTAPEFMPASRGFDFSFGTTGNIGEPNGSFYRGLERIPDPEGAPVSSPLYAREAVAFIGRNKDNPWFLYLAFNAVHSPVVASESVLKKFAHLPKSQQSYAALISEADDAIGAVLAGLREHRLEENTLIFCLSDNGGASGFAEMNGLRGKKWFVWEGGIRVPYMVQWKGRIPAGQVLTEPVIQLDVLPTALAAAGYPADPAWQLDGVNLLPLLEGKTEHLQPRVLYWRFGTQYAIRKGDLKLVKAGLTEPVMLVNLKDDPGETTDLTVGFPEKAQELQELWNSWNASMSPPRWEDKRWDDGGAAVQARKAKSRQQGQKQPGEL